MPLPIAQQDNNSAGLANPTGSLTYRGGLPGYMPNVGNFDRTVQGSELVSNQLAGLTASNGRYMRQAAARGAETAAARGSDAGSYYAGNAERAAIEAGLPIAMADAEAYRRAAEGNQQSDTSIATARLGAGASVASANIHADTSRFETEVNAALAREQNALNRELTREEQRQIRELTMAELTQRGEIAREGYGVQREGYTLQRDLQGNQQNWQTRENNFNRQFQSQQQRENFIEQTAVATMGTILGDPALFRDPAGASGMMNFFTTQMRDLMNQIFGGFSGGTGTSVTPTP